MALLSGKGLWADSGLTSLLSVFGEKVFLRGSEESQKLFVARGLGAVVGPFVLFALLQRSSLRTLAIGPCMMVYSLGYCFLSKSPSLEWAMVPIVLGHMGGGAMWQATTYAIQESVPDALRRRVFSFDQAILGVTYSLSTMGLGCSSIGRRAASVLCLSFVFTLLGLLLFVVTRRLWQTHRV